MNIIQGIINYVSCGLAKMETYSTSELEESKENINFFNVRDWSVYYDSAGINFDN